MNTATLGSRERPRRAQRLDKCRACGSEELWGGWFGPDGLATTDDKLPGAEWLTSCSSCGDFYRVGTSR